LQNPPNLLSLVRLFHEDRTQLGQFEPSDAQHIPEPYRGLLAHEHHMTVTVETFHRTAVDVRVLQKVSRSDDYAREILLVAHGTDQVVQYGIMRIQWRFLPAQVRAEIESEKYPLGHVLIRHDVLRRIHLHSLWRVQTGPVLDRCFGLPSSCETYGRVAQIDCNHEPAVELLEIVAPAEGVDWPR
jgi:chorismate-pyruvate lyase